MVPLAEPPVLPYAFSASVYVSVAYGSSYSNHAHSFFRKSWIHYQSLKILMLIVSATKVRNGHEHGRKKRKDIAINRWILNEAII